MRVIRIKIFQRSIYTLLMPTKMLWLVIEDPDRFDKLFQSAAELAGKEKGFQKLLSGNRDIDLIDHFLVLP